MCGKIRERARRSRILPMVCRLIRNIKYHKNRWLQCLAVVSNVPDTGYQLIMDIVLSRIQDSGPNRIPNS